MGRTILELAQEVTDREIVNRPTTLFGTNDRHARILRQAAVDTLRDLLRDGMRNGLSAFQSQWVFATKPGVYSYALPPDFLRVVPGTERRDRWPMGLVGPVSAQTWANWLTGVSPTAVPMGWRIQNNLIRIEPPPIAEELVLIDYISRWPVVREATEEDLASVNGHLLPVSPLVPREGYIARRALDAVDLAGGSTWGSAEWSGASFPTTPETELRRVPAGPRSQTGPTDPPDGPIDIEPLEREFPPFEVRAETFTADTDRSALHDDHVLSLGMTWRMRKALERPYAEERDQYEREKDVFLANDAARARIFTFGCDSGVSEVEPFGDGRWIVS